MTTTHTEALAILRTASGRHHLSLRVANEFFGRLRGLILAPPLQADHGLLLTRCNSVHTCFMRDGVDVVYLDGRGVVTKCVPDLQPWRASTAYLRLPPHVRRPLAVHVLELAPGTIQRLNVGPGSRLLHEALARVPEVEPGAWRERRSLRQRGSAMLEFTVVAPLITLLGLGAIQYGMLFHAKNQYNHAAFMAARAGSIHNASIDEIRAAYQRALIPLYGGGTNAAELKQAFLKAGAAVVNDADIVMLNPTMESFRDWNDPHLQKKFNTSIDQHVIPNGGLAFKKAAIIPAASGQSIQDANLLKLRIMHGYKPGVPLIGAMYVRFLKALDTGADPRATATIDKGQIPVVTHVTMQMQSDAIEGIAVSTPGMGNGGTPADSGAPPLVQAPPPSCAGVLCTEGSSGAAGGPSGGAASESGGVNDGEPGASGAGARPGGACMEPGHA